jgi:acetyl esterase/lipase
LKHHAVLLLAAASVAAALYMGAQPAHAAVAPKIDSTAFLGDHYPPRRTSFPDGVASYADVVYETIPGFRPVTLDLYLPASASPEGKNAAGKPLVIYIHGGGWQSGHSRQSGAFDDFPGVLASIAARGYVVASLNYRLSSEAPFPAAIRDVKSAIKWLRAHAAEYDINKDKAVVWGGSAGGQLTALAATTCGVKELEPVLPNPASPEAAAVAGESDCVQGAVTWYGIFDFSAIPPSQLVTPETPGSLPSAVVRYLGCGSAPCSVQTIRLASAISFVKADTPPFLLVHGAGDKVVNPAQSTQFRDALQKAGGHVDLLMIPAVDHSFIGATPEATRDASLEALKRTVQFIDATIGHSTTK